MTVRYYFLHTDLAGHNSLLEEILRCPRKRTSIGISANTIEEFDEQTATFESFDKLVDAFNSIYGICLQLSNPRIIVDVSSDLSKSYCISDIVYSGDKQKIADVYNMLLEHLQEHPEDINYFIGIFSIYQKKYSGDRLNDELIRRIVFAFFQGDGYKRRRDAYFTLKRVKSSLGH